MSKFKIFTKYFKIFICILAFSFSYFSVTKTSISVFRRSRTPFYIPSLPSIDIELETLRSLYRSLMPEDAISPEYLTKEELFYFILKWTPQAFEKRGKRIILKSGTQGITVIDLGDLERLKTKYPDYAHDIEVLSKIIEKIKDKYLLTPYIIKEAVRNSGENLNSDLLDKVIGIIDPQGKFSPVFTPDYALSQFKILLLQKFNANTVDELPSEYQEVYKGANEVINEWFRMREEASKQGFFFKEDKTVNDILYDKLMSETNNEIVKLLLDYERHLRERIGYDYYLRIYQVIAIFAMYEGFSAQIACNEGKSIILPGVAYLLWKIDGQNSFLTTPKSQLLFDLGKVSQVLQDLGMKVGVLKTPTEIYSYDFEKIGEGERLRDYGEPLSEKDVNLVITTDSLLAHHILNILHSYILDSETDRPFSQLIQDFKNWGIIGDEGDVTAFYRLGTDFIIASEENQNFLPKDSVGKIRLFLQNLISKLSENKGITLESLYNNFDQKLLDDIAQILDLPVDEIHKKYVLQAALYALKLPEVNDREQRYFIYNKEISSFWGLIKRITPMLILIDTVTGEALPTHNLMTGSRQFLEAILGLSVHAPTESTLAISFPLIANQIFAGRVRLASGTLNYQGISGFLEKAYGINTLCIPRHGGIRYQTEIVPLSDISAVADLVEEIKNGQGDYGEYKGSPIVLRCKTIKQAIDLAEELYKKGLITEDKKNELITAVFQYEEEYLKNEGNSVVNYFITKAGKEGEITITTLLDRGVNIYSKTGKLIVVAVGIYDSGTNSQLENRIPRGDVQEGLFIQVVLPSDEVSANSEDVQKARDIRFNEIRKGAEGRIEISRLLLEVFNFIDEYKSGIVDDLSGFLGSLGFQLKEEAQKDIIKLWLIGKLEEAVKRFFEKDYVLLSQTYSGYSPDTQLGYFLDKITRYLKDALGKRGDVISLGG